MPRTVITATNAIADAALSRIEQACEEGRFAAALEQGHSLGPLPNWPGLRGWLLGARLAEELGAPVQARRLRLLAYRHGRSRLEVWPDYLNTVAEMRGPLRAWHRLKGLPGSAVANAQVWSALFAVRARLAAQLKDFEGARRWLSEAELRSPGPWVSLERVRVFELEERFPEALGAAREALERHPESRPIVQATARLLHLLGRTDEALRLLGQTGAWMDSEPLQEQLGALLLESDKPVEAEQHFQRALQVSALLESELRRRLLACCVDAACRRSAFAQARLYACQLDSPFHRQLGERLASGTPQVKRVILPVEFKWRKGAVSSEAVLVALSHFWGRPAGGIETAGLLPGEVATARCERRWAEENGWAVREFELTWEGVVSLVARGVPFLITRAEAINLRAVAVVGCDTLRQTILLREARAPGPEEVPVARLSGSRALAIMPPESAARLPDLELAGEGVFDRLHALFLALEEHDRRKALEWLADLEQMVPEHSVILDARCLLADYDGDALAKLEATEAWLSRHPREVRLQLSRLELLRRTAGRPRRLNLLRELCEQPEAHPRLWLELAEELSLDEREERETSRLLRRVRRDDAANARTALLLARRAWRQHDFPRALELYRAASMLDDSCSAAARAWFLAARHLGVEEEVLTVLTDRVSRQTEPGDDRARILVWACEQLNRMPAAFQAIDGALEKEPYDGHLRLFAAETALRRGDTARAKTLLEQAPPGLPPGRFRRWRSRLAESNGDPTKALERWREVLAIEPTALDANGAIAELLSRLEGPGAGARHLRLVCARFPHHFGLHALWLRAMRHESAREIEPVLRRLIEVNPTNPRTHCDLARIQIEQGNYGAALESVQQSLSYAPDCSEAHRVLALVHERAARDEAAREALQDAVRLSVDNRAAVEQLLHSARTAEDQAGVLALVEAELSRQFIRGDGPLAFRELACGILDPEALLVALQRIQGARPDLHRAAGAVTLQLIELRRLDEAMENAVAATVRFPLQSEAWFHRALVCHAGQDTAGEIEALERALAADAANSAAAVQLAVALEGKGDLLRAGETLEAATFHNPSNPRLLLQLASVLWQCGQREEALARLRRVFVVEPLHDPAWDAFEEWARAMNEPGLPLRLARELVEDCPGNDRAWLALAQRLYRHGSAAEALQAVERAIRLHPRFVAAHDFRAQLLVAAKDRDAALEACHARVWEGNPPTELRVRATMVEAELGNLSQAVRVLKNLLADHPEHARGWRLLAEWSSRSGVEDDAIHAATQLVRLTPFSAGPIDYRAGLRLRRGDRAGAKADWYQALALDPHHEPAASNLFDVLLADGDLDGAEALLEHIQQQVHTHLPAACEIRLRAERSRKLLRGAARPRITREEDLQRALTAFRQLCRAKLEDARPLENAFKSLQRSRFEAAVDPVIEEMLREPEVTPFLGALWVRRRLARQEYDWLNELKALQRRGEIGHQALLICLGELAGRGQAARVRQLIAEHKLWLTLDSRGWLAAGLALGTLGLWDELLVWSEDWQNRPAVPPNLRLWLVRALRNEGRDGEADQVAREVAGIASRDAAVHRLQMWIAIEAAIGGDTQRAQQTLDAVDPVLVDDYHRHLGAFTRCLLRVQCAAPALLAQARRTAFQDVSRAAAEARLRKNDMAMRRIFRRTIRRLARDCGRPTLRLWGWFQS